MSAVTSKTIGTTLEIAKSYIARIGRVCITTPYMQTITEATFGNGLFNTFNDLLPAPDAAPGPVAGAAGNLTGAYGYIVQYFDSDRSVAGDNSAQSITVNPSSQLVDVDLTTFSNKAANSRVTHMDIYRNLNLGTTFFFVARVAIAATTYADNSTDASISANDSLELDNDVPTTQTYGLCHAHKNFMFLAGPYNGVGGTEYDDRYTFSKVANPDVYPLVNEVFIRRGMFGSIRALASQGDNVVFYKDQAIYELRFDTNPSGTTGTGSGVTVNTERGALNMRCVVDVQGTHYVLDTQGIYQFSGGANVVRLSEPLRGLWEKINWEQREKFSAVQTDDAVMFFVALDGATECNHAFVLDLNSIYLGLSPRWYKYSFDFGIRDVQRVQFSDDAEARAMGMSYKRVATFITEFGEVGYFGAGYRDMVAPQLTATNTVTSSTTTTLTVASPSTFTRPNANGHTEDVLGAYVRFLVQPTADKPGSADWSEPYRISIVNSATQITVSPAMPEAPAAGTVFVVGAIPDARIATPMLDFGASQQGKKAKRMSLEWQPRGVNHTVGVERHLDYKGAVGNDATVTQTEFDATAGEYQYHVNQGGTLDGKGAMGARYLPAPAEGFRKMQVILDATGVDKPTIIDAIGIEIEMTEES